MRLSPGDLRTAFRAVVGRIAAGSDASARAAWWREVEGMMPAPRETCPGRLTAEVIDLLPESMIWELRLCPTLGVSLRRAWAETAGVGTTGVGSAGSRSASAGMAGAVTTEAGTMESAERLGRSEEAV